MSTDYFVKRPEDSAPLLIARTYYGGADRGAVLDIFLPDEKTARRHLGRYAVRYHDGRTSTGLRFSAWLKQMSRGCAVNYVPGGS